jgi:hypothetical protein
MDGRPADVLGDRPAEIRALLARAVDQLTAAGRRLGVRRHIRQVGPWRIEQRHIGPALEDLMCPAWAHLPVPECKPALVVHCCELESTGLDLGPLPWRGEPVKAQGEVTGLAHSELRVVWDPEGRSVQILDRRQASGLFCVQARRHFRSWERSFPLRNILHWWAGPTSGQLMHAGAVGTPAGGALLLGAGGAGKSTTTLACLGSALRIAGDDFVLVDTEPSATVYSVYATAKLERGTLARFPILAERMANPHGSDEEKAMFFLDRIAPSALIGSFPLKALLVLKVTGESDTRIEPASPAAALQATGPNTMFLLPSDREEAFRKIARLVRSRPCFTLWLGSDLAQIPQRIGELLDRL